MRRTKNLAAVIRMLPQPKPPKPKKPNTGLTLPIELMQKLDAIRATEGVKSRNALIVSFLQFAVDLFPRFKKQRKRLDEVEDALGGTETEAIAHLVELGLSVFDRDTHKKK